MEQAGGGIVGEVRRVEQGCGLAQRYPEGEENAREYPGSANLMTRRFIIVVFVLPRAMAPSLMLFGTLWIAISVVLKM